MHYLLSIVIVTYKEDSYIYDCLNSIFKYNDIGEQLKVIVVDNSPAECSIAEKCSAQYPNVLFIPNPTNTGFGAANNIGAAAVDSDFILFFNNDTELIEPIFKKIIAQFNGNSKLGCLGIQQKGAKMSYFIRGECSVIYSSQELKQHIKKNCYDERYNVLSGAFMFFRRTAFEECGRFDENIFMFGEESDILKRLHDIGYNSTYQPNLQFLHKLGNRRKTKEFLDNITSHTWCYYLKKYDIPHKKKLLHKFIFGKRKLQLYFLLKLDFKEAVKIQRVISYRCKLFNTFFERK